VTEQARTGAELASAGDAASPPAPVFGGVFGRVYGMLNRVFVALGHVALFGMMALTSIDALSRYLFTRPLGGMEELTEEFFMPALVYLVAAHIYDQGGHIRITTVMDFFPPWLRKASLWLGDIAGTVFFGLITYGVATRMIEAYRMQEYSSSPLNYLLAHSYAIVAAGCALLTLRMFISVVTGRHPTAPEPTVG